MALVSYTYSSSENEDSGEEDGGGQVITISNPSNEKHLFEALPLPKTSTGTENILEEQDEFLLKKETPTEQPKPKVKITLEALTSVSDSDEDEPQVKKPKRIKGSGLFALLPPPKCAVPTATQFVPNAVKKKILAPPRQAMASKAKPASVAKAQAKVAQENVEQEKVEQEESDDEDTTVELFDEQSWKQLCGRKKRKALPVVKVTNGHANTESERAGLLEGLNMKQVNATPEADIKQTTLDNDAFKKLVGSSKLVKPNPKLVDINEEDILPDKDIWMTKALTDPDCKPATVIENPVNDTCRKKHHITYLAQQAKANEQELQTQWAASRHTRKQTQAKYGF